MTLRDISVVNDAERSRSLIGSIMIEDVATALTDWTASGGGGIVIGELAVSYHVEPRPADCIELFVADRAMMPEFVAGFTRLLPATYVHDRTNVLVHVRSPAFMNVPAEIAQRVVETAMSDSGISVASESGLIALKLFRQSRRNFADIVALVRTGRGDVSAFPLPAEQIDVYQRLLTEARDTAITEPQHLLDGCQEWPEHRVVELDLDLLSDEHFHVAESLTAEEFLRRLRDLSGEEGPPSADRSRAPKVSR